MSLVSVYIHVPFCIHRCGYCDFNTYAGKQHLIPAYSDAVCIEIESLARKSPELLDIGTVYFGGGTPSLLPIKYLENILYSLNQKFHLRSEIEISLEANPGTVSENYLRQLKEIGFNRISFGMQSANADELKLLERQHDLIDVYHAIEWARAANFNNINLDLIFGLPYQTLPAWRNNLEVAVGLHPEHLSLYALTIEEGTPFYKQLEKGIITNPDPDLSADMYESASEYLSSMGYHQYEISNWARMNSNGELLSCKHNLQYWRSLPYLGIGAGAHGFINHQRTINVAAPSQYIKRLLKTNHDPGNLSFPQTPATIEILAIDKAVEIGETMMMGLRLTSEGVSNVEFLERFGINLESKFSGEINQLISAGLLEWGGEEHNIIRLTKKGRLLGNRVFMEFI